MPVWLYEAGPNGLGVFLLVTVALGGLAAWATGRAVAQTWRPLWQIPVYAMLLALAVRFLHFGLFEEPLLHAGNLIVDYAVLLVAALCGHRLARGAQLLSRYHWLFEAAGRLGWRTREDSRRPADS